jgi:hypothetical protein
MSNLFEFDYEILKKAIFKHKLSLNDLKSIIL